MIETKIGKDIGQINDLEVEMALVGYVSTKDRIDKLKTEQDNYKARLVEAAEKEIGDLDSATITLGMDDKKVKISFGWDAKITDEEKLRKILEERFYDLVSETITQKPEKKLKEMALSDDGIRECLLVKPKAPSVTVVKTS